MNVGAGMGHAPQVLETIAVRAAVGAASVALVGCEPVVHGYRTGVLTSAMVLAIVALTVFFVMRHVHHSGKPRRVDAGRRRRARRAARAARPAHR